MWKYCFVLLPVFYSSASLAANPVQITASAGISLDDNITRAQKDSDIFDDNIINADIAASYKIPVNDSSYISTKASLNLEQYLDFDDLNTTAIGLQAIYHYKPFTGYTASRFYLLAAYQHRMVDNAQREGSAIRLRLGFSKRLTDRITLRASLGDESISADDSVFDQDNSTLSLGLDYRLSESNILYFSYSTRDGTIITTAQDTVELQNAAHGNFVIDEAFPSASPMRMAYNIDGDTTLIQLGNTYSLDSRQAIDASILFYNSSGYGGNEYDGNIINIDYIYRF